MRGGVEGWRRRGGGGRAEGRGWRGGGGGGVEGWRGGHHLHHLYIYRLYHITYMYRAGVVLT